MKPTIVPPGMSASTFSASSASSRTRENRFVLQPLHQFLAVLLACLSVLLLLPVALGNGSALAVVSQIGVWIIFALAYNICLGQTGLLSFCHALFFGFGAYAASLTVNAVVAGRLPFVPVWIMPLIGFVVGGAFGALVAAFLCKRVGVAFVMITLGLSQLVIYLSNALGSVFGGESGISIDRAYGGNFGPQMHVYWLISAWLLVAGLGIWLLGQTAFGKLAKAVRENEERVRFLGQDVVRVRFLAIMLSAAFAGLAGALHAINIEQVSVHLLGLKTSAFVLFMVVIGGARSFFGPVIGAILIALLDKVLPDYTGGWLLYLGLSFCVVILRAPGGFMEIVEQRWRLLSTGRMGWTEWAIQDSQRVFGGLLVVIGIVMLIEMASALSSGANFYEARELSLIGLRVSPHSVFPWLIAAAACFIGLIVLRRVPELKKA